MRWNWPAPVPSATTGSTLTVTLRPSRYTLSFTRWPPTYGVTVPSTIMRWPTIMNGGLPRARSTASCTRPGAAGAAGGGSGAAPSALPADRSDPTHAHANAAGAEGTLMTPMLSAAVHGVARGGGGARSGSDHAGADQRERDQRDQRERAEHEQHPIAEAPFLEAGEGDRVVQRVPRDARV